MAIKETVVTTIWYKLYVRVGLDGLHLSSGNFATLYYNGTTYNWIVDDHECDRRRIKEIMEVA